MSAYDFGDFCVSDAELYEGEIAKDLPPDDKKYLGCLIKERNQELTEACADFIDTIEPGFEEFIPDHEKLCHEVVDMVSRLLYEKYNESVMRPTVIDGVVRCYPYEPPEPDIK